LRVLHLLDVAELGIDLLGGLLADVAGVQHHQVGALGVVDDAIAQRTQDIGHALAVIDVHLTAVGLDIEALLRGLAHGEVMGSQADVQGSARSFARRWPPQGWPTAPP
jgi:hypothetical protein